MYKKITNINKTLRKEEIAKLEHFKSKNKDKDVQVYYVTTACGCGFSYIATTNKPYDKNFGNCIDITDYDGRLEKF